LLGRAVNEVFNGGVDPHNPYNWFINEYSDRIRLKKMGFNSSFNDLDPFKAQVFIKIDVELDRLRERRQKLKEMQSKSRTHGRK